MPTINQLVNKPRETKVVKSNSPALNKGHNSFKKTQTNNSPQKRGGMYSCGDHDNRRNLTQLYVNMPVCVCLTLMEVTAYIPGIGHNLQEHSVVFNPRWSVKDFTRGTLPHRSWCA